MQLKLEEQLVKLNWIKYYFTEKSYEIHDVYNDTYPAVYGSLISSDPIFTKLETLKASKPV